MLKRVAALCLLGASLVGWAGCAKVNSHYVYVSVPATNQIFCYREDPNSGVLTNLSTSPFTVGAGVQSLVLHPSHKFMYAANSGEGTVSVFTFDSGGDIFEQQVPRPTAGISPISALMDPAGSYLYVTSAGSNNIFSYSIDSSKGSLSQLGSPVNIGIAPNAVALAPSGAFLYVVASASNTSGIIEVFSISAGTLTFVTSALTGVNPQSIAVSADSNFLYVANASDNTISAFSASTSAPYLQPLGSPLLNQSYAAPLALLLDPSGKNLYVANNGSGNVAAYAVQTNGTLEIESTPSYGTNAKPSLLFAEPNGKYVMVGNQSSPAIEVFSLTPSDGYLTEVASYPIGNTPTSIAVVP